MTKEKMDWDDIPSIEGMEVDWQFEPENPLGKRTRVRIANSDLFPLLGVQSIPTKVVSKNFDEIGLLVDIAQSGLAVQLKTTLAKDQLVKIGLFLGKQKIVSRAVVRNIREEEGRFRTGMEFIELDQAHQSFIVSLIASKVYTSAS